MKKIVALVLSLVMALSLCTVAFGATEVYGLTKKGGNVNDADLRPVTVEYVKATADKNGAGWIAYYTCDFNDDDVVDSFLIPCNQADADYAIYKNDSFLTWVKEDMGSGSYDANGRATAAYYNFVATAQKETSAKPNCTTDQFFYDGYVDADGCCFFVEEPAVKVDADKKALNVDGKIVIAYNVTEDTDYVVWASHIFAKGVANEKTGYDVCTCLICKGEFAATSDEAVATKNGYKVSTGFEYSTDAAANVYNENAYDNGYDFAWGQKYSDDYKFVWQLKAGTTEEIGTTTTTTTTTTTGVESAKTFDAGIAMYVGMSLMSVAGTAVVIGKKKEF